MKHTITILTALLLAPLAALHAADAPKLLPPDWDPKTAADKVLSSLIKVTARFIAVLPACLHQRPVSRLTRDEWHLAVL